MDKIRKVRDMNMDKSVKIERNNSTKSIFSSKLKRQNPYKNQNPFKSTLDNFSTDPQK